MVTACTIIIKRKTSGATFLLPCLCVHICKSVISKLLFTVESSWVSVLWIVPVMMEVHKKQQGWGKCLLVLQYH